MATDEAVADRLVDAELEPYGLRFSEWAPEAELLAAVYEQLQVIANVLVVVNNGHAHTVQRWPRPKSALQLRTERKRIETHRSLVRRLTPPDR